MVRSRTSPAARNPGVPTAGHAPQPNRHGTMP